MIDPMHDPSDIEDESWLFPAPNHINYAGCNLIMHCKNALPSAQLREDILNFSLDPPTCCFAGISPSHCLFQYVPEFLSFVKGLVCPSWFHSPLSCVN